MTVYMVFFYYSKVGSLMLELKKKKRKRVRKLND